MRKTFLFVSTACCVLLAACGGGSLSVGGASGSGATPGASGSGTSANNGSGSGSGGQVASNGGGATTGSDGSVTVSGDDGAVTAQALPPNIGGTQLTNRVQPLVRTGNALLTPVTTALSPVTNQLPANSNVSGAQVSSNGQSLLGVGGLSPEAQTGSLGGVNLLSGQEAAAVSVLPGGVDGAGNPLSNAPLTASVGNTTIGGTPSQPVAVSILSPNAANGSVLSANVLSAGQSLSANLNPIPTDTGTGKALGAVTAGNTTVLDGTNPLLGVSALSKRQNSGSLVTAGVASGGQPLTVKLGGKSLLPVK